MKTFLMLAILTGMGAYGLGQMGIWDDFKSRSEVVHNYENRALQLSKESRELKAQVSKLQYQIQTIEAKNNYLAMKLEKRNRSVASIPQQSANDLVKYEVYQWTPEKLLAIGGKEFHFKNYQKSAQFYNAFLSKFPSHQGISDEILFEAGVAAYESKDHYPWAIKHFDQIVKNHPKSKYYRGAKLWLALSHLNMGDHKKFINTVEEFRKKYRNTEEWKILSAYYDEVNQKYRQ